jgi:Flp pilus assembly protein TadG
VRRRDERGVAAVEAAFVLPLLLLFVLGIIDLGMWNFQRSQASSGARDGARSAIVSVAGADCTYPCSTPNTAVRDAIAKRLGDQSFTFTVQCMSSTTTTAKTCAVNADTVDRDRVKVTVTWTRPAMTFVSKLVGASSTVSGSSTMTING